MTDAIREAIGMLLEDTEFPIVRMRYGRADPRGAADAIDRLDTLLGRKQPFVLVRLGFDTGRDHGCDERKRIAAWLKNNREPLQRFVKALVYVGPSPAEVFVARKAAPAFKEFWGYPMLIAASEAAAEQIADRLLEGELPAAIEDELTEVDCPTQRWVPGLFRRNLQRRLKLQ